MKVTRHDDHTALLYRSSSKSCRALSANYAGLRFERLAISLLAESALARYRGADAVEVHFTLVGRAADLLRHRFALPEWLAPGAEEAVRCPIAGCYAWRIERRSDGYWVSQARYQDGLDQLAGVLFPPLWADVRSRFTKPG